jgi:uncharacterized membrane protein
MNTPFSELIVVLASVVPFVGIAGSLAVGKLVGLAPTAALFWALIGNTLAAILAFALLDFLFKHVIFKIKFLEQKFKKKFEKLHQTHSEKFNSAGLVFLTIFTASPLPGTGAYTGVLIAYIFNAPFWPSVLAITLGNIVKGLILTGGLESILFFFQHGLN